MNPRIGKVPQRGETDGVNRREAERALRRLVEIESVRRPPALEERPRSVDDVVEALRDRLALQGARLSYRQNCESMQRVHISPAMGARRVESVTREDVERLARSMLARGLAPKTVRNVMSFLHSAFELAVENGWIARNPVARAARPLPRRHGDASPDLQFLTLNELRRVIEAIPDQTIVRKPKERRDGRPGTAPPPPPDVLGPVIRVMRLEVGVVSVADVDGQELLPGPGGGGSTPTSQTGWRQPVVAPLRVVTEAPAVRSLRVTVAAHGEPRMTERHPMKIVVIGASGLVGSQVVTQLGEHGHEAIAASLDSGVNTLTGEGLPEVLDGGDVVIDVSNSPSFEDAAVLKFFEMSTGNLLAAEKAAGVGHHVALSVVGTERLADKGYFHAKRVQEKLIAESSIPYSIVHATQFFEFITSIAAVATDGEMVRLPPVLFQPMASEDVAKAVGRIAVGSPVNGIVEVAGPEKFRMDELVRRALTARNDPRQVVTDPTAPYFGAYEVDDSTLVPADGALLGEVQFHDWLERQLSVA